MPICKPLPLWLVERFSIGRLQWFQVSLRRLQKDLYGWPVPGPQHRLVTPSDSVARIQNIKQVVNDLKLVFFLNYTYIFKHRVLVYFCFRKNTIIDYTVVIFNCFILLTCNYIVCNIVLVYISCIYFKIIIFP